MSTHRVITIKAAESVCGSLTHTSKMPCASYSLPTIACRTGAKMAQIPGSVCSSCYADKGFYAMYAGTIEPSQVARLDSVLLAMSDPSARSIWIDAMTRLAGKGPFFRWHDSGDLQGLAHIELIVAVCRATPGTRHWLPTREYGMVKAFIAKHGRDSIPSNLVVRLSAMYPDQPVIVPASLQGIPGIATSNVHTGSPMGQDCAASKQGGACLDCRACWSRDTAISYKLH